MEVRSGHVHSAEWLDEVDGALHDSLYQFTVTLQKYQFQWPFGSLEDRVSLHRMLVRFVADTLVADRR